MRPFARNIAILALIFWFGVRSLIGAYWPSSYFATNVRRDGPPIFTVSSGPLVYGEAGTPRVYANWLAHRDFRDDRTIEIYHNTALGETKCFGQISPPGGFRDRKGGVQPKEGYSLDRWTNFTLARCNLEPGTYVLVTTYHVDIWGGIFETNFSITSNPFTIVGEDEPWPPQTYPQ